MATKMENKDDSSKYFDILLLGKRGMGKSTTGNLILKENDTPHKFKQWTSRHRGLLKESALREPTGFMEGDTDSIQSTTACCEMISNEKCERKYRVLDTPGFMSTSMESTFTLFTNIIDLTNEHHLCFSRVLYFLPVREQLQKADGIVFEELNNLKCFFGKRIFDSMIVIATEDPLNKEEEWQPEKRERTEDSLKAILQRADIDQTLPVVFLPASAPPTQNSLLDILKTTVRNEVKFDIGKCRKCAAYYSCDDKDNDRAHIHHGGFDNTKCHPILMFKYSDTERIVSTVLHLVTFGITYAARKKMGVPGVARTVWCTICQKKSDKEGCTKLLEELHVPIVGLAHPVHLIMKHDVTCDYC